jgi:peptide chain release factor subunit 1
MNLTTRLSELARIRTTTEPVVSVYLDTHWTDEHQRERVRVFLKTELRKARDAATGPGSTRDLAWIEAESEALIAQARVPEARGVALLAGEAVGLREVLPVRARFDNLFVLGPAPHLRPLAAAAARAEHVLVVFVDAESARLVPVEVDGAGDEVSLESDVPGQHRRGGWAQLAQSRYQRHIRDHRGRHFDAVAAAVSELADGSGIRRLVLAGEREVVAAFRKHLPDALATTVAGTVAASRHEAVAILVDRATDLVDQAGREGAGRDADDTLTEAAKGGRAIAGLEGTLEAVLRGTVHRLYLLEGFDEPGQACTACGGLQPGADDRCRRCGAPTTAAELGEAMVNRVLATGGRVEPLATHPGLDGAGGVAARLRYAL